MPKATEALFRRLLLKVRGLKSMNFHYWSPDGYKRHSKDALERMTSKLEVLKPHLAFVSIKNALAIPKLQYVPRVMLA